MCYNNKTIMAIASCNIFTKIQKERHHMITYRVKCINVGCKKCSKAVRVGTSFFGDDLYTCSAYQRKHKEIKAKDCGSFTCKDPEFVHFCRNCRGGE